MLKLHGFFTLYIALGLLKKSMWGNFEHICSKMTVGSLALFTKKVQVRAARFMKSALSLL